MIFHIFQEKNNVLFDLCVTRKRRRTNWIDYFTLSFPHFRTTALVQVLVCGITHT